MAVQIINDMPDVEVHRGEPVAAWLRDLNAPRPQSISRFNGRALFMGITIGLHVIVAIALVRMQFADVSAVAPPAIEAALIEDLPATDVPPPAYTPPPMNLVYSLPTPQEISIETTAVSQIAGTTVTSTEPVAVAPPMVESVEYVRASPPVYPRESQRRREHGTVILRVLVDEAGRPAQIQVEQSSGFERLDLAAREAVEKFLFRPYEVNGIPHAAQVLIPIGFDRRS
jgi:periplasmic protein TonB